MAQSPEMTFEVIPTQHPLSSATPTSWEKKRLKGKHLYSIYLVVQETMKSSLEVVAHLTFSSRLLLFSVSFMYFFLKYLTFSFEVSCYSVFFPR